MLPLLTDSYGDIFLKYFLHAECEQTFSPQEWKETLPVFVKRSREKRHNFLVNNVSQQLSGLLVLYLRRHRLVLVGSSNLVFEVCLGNKKGDANRNGPEALQRTLFWCSIPLKDLCFYPCALNICFICLCGTCPAVECPPWYPNSRDLQGQLRTGTALLQSWLFTQVPHVLPKPQPIPALAMSTNLSQKCVLFQCQCWNMCLRTFFIFS